MRRPSPRARGAVVRTGSSRAGPARSTRVVGGATVTNCHMPAQRPFAGRCSMSHRSPRRMQNVARRSSGRRLRLARGGDPLLHAGGERLAVLPHGADQALRRAGGADGRAELHQRGVEVADAPRRAGSPRRAARAGPGSRGRAGRSRCGRCGRGRARRCRRRSAHGGRRRSTRRPRRCTGRRRAASSSSSRSRGSWPPCSATTVLAAALEVAGAGVIAEPLPHAQHVLLVGGGEVGERREPLEEPVEVRDDRRDLRLLEHRLADEHVVRVGGGGVAVVDAATAGVRWRSVVPGSRRRSKSSGRRTQHGSILRGMSSRIIGEILESHSGLQSENRAVRFP